MGKRTPVFCLFISILLILGLCVAGCTTATSPSIPAEQTPFETSPPVTVAATTAAGPVTTPPASSPVTTTAAQGITYTNATYGISLTCPKDWELQEPDALGARDYGKTTRNIANFFSPGAGAYATFSIDVDPVAATDLENYYNKAVLSLQTYYLHWQMTKHNPQLKVSDNFAYRIDYEITKDDSSKIDDGFQVYTIVDGTPYIFTFQGEKAAYNEYLDDAQDMIRSVKITPVTIARSR